MKLYDIDNQESHNLSKEASEYLLKEYPPDDYDEMYDMNDDMCLDEREFEDIEIELAQRKLIGV